MDSINFATAATLVAAANGAQNRTPRDPELVKYDGLIADMVLAVRNGVKEHGGRGTDAAATVTVAVATDSFASLSFAPKYGLGSAASSPTVRKAITNDLERIGVRVTSFDVGAGGGLQVTAFQKHNMFTGALAAVAKLAK